MLIALDTPFSVGDLNKGVSYPHVYITGFNVNGSAMFAMIHYEIGTFTPGTPLGTWKKAPEVPGRDVTLSGELLYPFFLTTPTDTERPLWDQVEELLYAQIQGNDARCVGTIRVLEVSDANQ